MSNPTDDGADTVEAGETAAEVGRAQPVRPHEPSRPDYPEFPYVDPAHYVIAKEIARGGMGRISVARDLRLGREVAVKEMLSTDLARRFEREVRITARLQHPSIVSVHEAGRWPSGEPFYAMKLVSGRSLHEVIGAATKLADRLASIPSVLAIADAMAYVHRERVIHRDLKPQNVIVGEFGETVVIDWGIAKQLDTPDPTISSETAAGSGETSAGEVLGTPAYMPPEQAAGEPVDERADVYAIGAILYHVLTGRAPFVAESFAELLAKVHDEAPAPIADVEPDAPPDLIAIAERAMARDRAARYPTARELADDLRRFQTGQLVGAHRYSFGQLARRWARRHRAVLAAVVIATIVIAVVGVVAVRRVMAEQGRAEEQSVLAKRNQGDAEQLMRFMLQELRAHLMDAGRVDLLESVSRRAVAYYDAHGGTGSDEDLIEEARARLGIADILQARGEREAARVEIGKVVAMVRPIAARRPGFAPAESAIAEAALVTGHEQITRGDSAAALASFREAEAAMVRLLAIYPDDRSARRIRAQVLSEIAAVLDTRGDRAGAMAASRQAVALLPSSDTPDQEDDTVRSGVLETVGGELLAAGDNRGALAAARGALEVIERELKAHPRSLRWTNYQSRAHDHLGKVLQQTGDLDGALVEFRAGLAIDERLVIIDPTNTFWRQSLSVAHESVATIMTTRGDLAGATSELRAALAINTAIMATDHADMTERRGVSVLKNKLGDVQAAAGDVDAAIASYRSGLAIRDELVRIDPRNAGWQRDLFYSHFRLAGLLYKSHDLPHAIDELRAARQVALATATRAPDDASAQNDLARTEGGLAGMLVETRDLDGARRELEAALAIAVRMSARAGADPKWPALASELRGELAAVARTPVDSRAPR